MRPLVREEIVGLEPYAEIRDGYRGAVIDHKRRRRMQVGPSVTLVFEDLETLRFQVQEMLYIERIDDPERIQHELDVYNELMPVPGELSATLFVEIGEPDRIRAELDQLIGIDEHVALVLGEGGDEQVVPARFDPKQFEEDRISAVQYIRFRLDDAQVEAFADESRPAAVRIAHPAYAHTAPIPPEVRQSLAAGLREAPPVLLPPIPEALTASQEVLFETAHARVLGPARGARAGSCTVEARAPWPGEGGDEDAWRDVLGALRRVASEVAGHHGGCLVVAEWVPDRPMRWQVIPRPERDAPRT